MTGLQTPIQINDRIHHLPSDLADSITLSRARMDAKKVEMEDEEDEDEEDDNEEDEDDEPEEDMKTKMANLRKQKKDSDDLEDHADALEVALHESEFNNAVLSTIARMDAEDEGPDEEDMEEYDPVEIAKDMLMAYEESKPYLPQGITFEELTDSTEDGDFDSFDIYATAVFEQVPDIDVDSDDEVYGAFRMLQALRPMGQRMMPSLDSADSDFSFSSQLGLRQDSSAVVLKPAFVLKPLY